MIIQWKWQIDSRDLDLIDRVSKELLTDIGNIVQFSAVAQSCPTLCNPIDCSMPCFPVLYQLPELAQIHVHSVSDGSDHPSHPPSSPSPPHSIVPSNRVFSNKSVLGTSWPKYWSFSFSISPSNEYSGLISLKIDWLDLLAVQWAQESSPTPQFKSINSSALGFLYSSTLTSIHDYWKNHSFD